VYTYISIIQYKLLKTEVWGKDYLNALLRASSLMHDVVSGEYVTAMTPGRVCDYPFSEVV
jgi:hypothetical protein